MLLQTVTYVNYLFIFLRVVNWS